MASIDIRTEHLDELVVGQLSAKWSARGDRILRYYIDFRHKSLNLHKEVSAPELFILQNKVDALMASWDKKFVQHQKREMLQAGQDTADEATVEALAKLESLQHILQHTVDVDDAIDWESLKDRTPFQGQKNFPEAKPKFREMAKPEYSEPKIGFLDFVLGRKNAILSAAEQEHDEAVMRWEEKESERKANFKDEVDQWENRKATFEENYRLEKQNFDTNQRANNAKIDELKSSLAHGDEDAVVEHATMVLENSDYDDLFEKSFIVQYHKNERLVLVAYDLPGVDDLPTVKSVRFVKSTGEWKETEISQRDKSANFDSVCYQICLRTIHELFEADEFGNLDRVLFNGYVNFVDDATGQDARTCILSVLVKRSEFEQIDLSRVDPKSCFKSLQGVAAAKLASIAPIAPVMEMDREDRRFIEGRDVGSGMEDGMNIAAMSWEDFEHLVRELFEKEFAVRGGEVKVTQSSRDQGVDAIAFDPDPITGGKIIIQAKRYTRTVGVSAVRDLFGSVMNEGASKGILITTADYGPDAHKFASDKPLTLLNGGHLLHMLEKHGYNARVDLAEAREANNSDN